MFAELRISKNVFKSKDHICEHTIAQNAHPFHKHTVHGI